MNYYKEVLETKKPLSYKERKNFEQQMVSEMNLNKKKLNGI